MKTPKTLQSLEVSHANKTRHIARILFVVFRFVRWLVKLPNHRYGRPIELGLDPLRPMVLDSLKQISEPLTSDVIANYTEQDA